MADSTAVATEVPAASRSAVWIALGALYFIWGSTYLAIRVALEDFPPLLLAGFRFTLAGVVLLLWQQLRRAPFPKLREWRAAAIVGLLLIGANTLVTAAELWVSSSLSAVAIASTPLWVGLFAGLSGRWPARSEWLGICVGLSGVVLLNLGGDLRGQPLGAFLLFLSTIFWALGALLRPRLALPAGLSGTGALMLVGGIVDLLLAVGRGETLTHAPGGRAIFAFLWLVVMGSIIAYTAFAFLLANVRLSLATSYAYVNPVVAMILGALLLHEPITPLAMAATVLILLGVAMLARAKKSDPNR